MIEEAFGPVEGVQERIDPLPQLKIGRALTIQDDGAGRGIVAFDGRQENGLNALWIEWHWMVLQGSGDLGRANLLVSRLPVGPDGA